MNRKNNILKYKNIKLCVLCANFVSFVVTFFQPIYKSKQTTNHSVLRSSVFGLLTLFTLTINAQVSVQTDTTRIRIGEQIQLKYIVENQEGVRFPNKLVLDSLQKIEVVKQFNVDTINNKLIKKYALTSFDSGQYELPAQLINIQGKQYKTKPITFDVSTVAVDTTKQKLFPIKAIQHQKLTLKDYAKNLWYLWLIIPLIFGLIWWFFIRKKETEEERIAKIPPFQMAVQQLEQLDKKLLWQNNKTKEYYSELTDILRTYIEKEFKVPAMESTTSELINALKKFKNESGLDISGKTIIKLKDLLKEADLVKFAKSKPYAEEIQMHRKYADAILDGMKFEEEEIPENPNGIETDQDKLVEVTQVETVKKKLSKKQKRNIIIISIVLLLSTAGIFLGKTVYEKVMLKIGRFMDTKSTKQLSKSTWQVQKISDLSLETPVVLNKEPSSQLPDDYRKIIVSMDNYLYQSLVNQLQIIVTNVEYVPEVPISLENAVSGMINQIESNKDIKNFKYDIERLDKFDIEGVKVFGTMADKTIEKNYELQLFVNNNKMSMVMVSYKSNDDYGKQIKERIFNSLNIKTQDAK